MKRRRLLFLALALAGCVPSWNAFYNANDVVFDPALIGTWRPVQAKDTSKEAWEFARSGDQAYKLTQTDEEGRRAEFDVRLFKLKEQRFVDLYVTKLVGDGLQANAWAGISLVPAHLLLKVEQVEPQLKLAAMNPDRLRKFLKQHPEAIAHQIVGEGDVVLTADTSALQKFVVDHLGDPEFFGGAMEMKRKQ